MSRPEVVIFYVDAGGGHRAAVRALEAAAETRGAPFLLTPVNLQTVLQPLDVLRRVTGVSIEQTYNALIRRRHRTPVLVGLLRVLQTGIRVRRRALTARVAAELARRRPRAVVSVMPNFNGVIRDAVRQSLPDTPFVVILTDLADFPPHFWIEPGIPRVVVGTEHAALQAARLGLPGESIRRTSGMILHPRFYGQGGDRARAGVRREMGIPPPSFTTLLLFGGKGSAEIPPLASSLLEEDPSFHVIAVCGENPSLFGRLGELESRSGGRLKRLGFTDRIAELMAASDVVVTKPGPGTLAEAFHQRVPVVVTFDERTIPQECFNARFVDDKGLGLVVHEVRLAPAAAARIARDNDLREALHRSLASLPPNRAVYEATEILAEEVARVA